MRVLMVATKTKFNLRTTEGREMVRGVPEGDACFLVGAEVMGSFPPRQGQVKALLDRMVEVTGQGQGPPAVGGDPVRSDPPDRGHQPAELVDPAR